MPESAALHSRYLSGVPAGRKNGSRIASEGKDKNPSKEPAEKQFDFSRKIRELRLELEIKKREEERIEKDIAIILEENTIDGGEQNRSFGLAVTRLNNHMLVVENSAKQLTSALKNISSLADTISGRVSALDVAKTRVVGCLQLAGDMRDLGVCAEGIDDAIRSEDFETASQHIHRFLTLDQAVFQIREFKQKDATDSIRHSYEVLSSAKERLSKILKSRLTEAVQKEDVAEMQRFVKLFPMIHESDEGLQRYSVFLNQKIDKLAEDNLKIMKAGGTDDNRRNVLYADTLFMFFEGVADIIESNLPVLEHSYGLEKLLDFMFILQARIDEFFRRLLEEFDTRRRLSHLNRLVDDILHHKKSATDHLEDSPDPLEVDAIASEICMMNTSVDMYWRFVGRRIGKNDVDLARSPSGDDDEEIDEEARLERQRLRKEAKEQKMDQLLNRSRVGTKMQELIGKYCLLEHFYMLKSVQKAIKSDAKEDVGGLTSSVVDDVVFIIRKSIRRAAGSGNVDSVCATINNATALLDTVVHNSLHHNIQAGYVTSANFASEAFTAYQQGKQVKEAAESQKEQFLLALNNSAKLSELLIELQKGLIMEWSKIKRPPVEKNKLEHSTTQIEESAKKLSSLAKHGAEELFKSAFKNKIRQGADPYQDIDRQMTMQDVEHYEAHDPFMEHFLAQIDRLLVENEPVLFPDNYKTIVLLTSSEIARQIEAAIAKCQFNRYGALQLDREYRQICAYLTNVAGWSAREKVGRLGQIVALLNVETIDEAMEVWHNSKTMTTSTTRTLTLPEVRKVLALRADFPTIAIKSIE
ncbi:CBN-COGC-4 protein [Caenorhabditis brenneri]|uniref:Conserved oligomeric Golgi complex subunit 4 n=1 Tax=Caenorhabditis brenneri TaxID=135651 RepID=G0NWB5_CAEBE|nr:CBN-COGC-4 protein [Caenorhabditis brenneri]